MEYKIKDDTPKDIFEAVVERIELLAHRDKDTPESGWAASYAGMIRDRLTTLNAFIADWGCEQFKDKLKDRIEKDKIRSEVT